MWQKQRGLLELTDKTVSILGFGNVGQEIAKRLKAFGVETIGLDIKDSHSEYLNQYLDIKYLDDALKQSDIIILTLPLTKETKEIINQETIDKMKNETVLINIARGGLINESDLIKALNQKKFLGIALDVFEEEPLLKENSLWEDERVLISPHNSFVSDKVNERLFNLIIENLKY